MKGKAILYNCIKLMGNKHDGEDALTTEDMVLQAIGTGYTVTYVYNIPGMADDTASVPAGSPVPNPGDPHRNRYTFEGWSYAGRIWNLNTETITMPSENTTLRYFEEIAMRDQLTNLYSRNAYIEMAKVIVTQQNMPLCVVVGDANHLKVINDTHGHIGGDEFVILVPNLGQAVTAYMIECINADLANITDDKFGQPEVAWGCAVMESPSQDYNAIFKQADAMMYETKKKRNVFRSGGLLPDEDGPQEPPGQEAESGGPQLPMP